MLLQTPHNSADAARLYDSLARNSSNAEEDSRLNDFGNASRYPNSAAAVLLAQHAASRAESRTASYQDKSDAVSSPRRSTSIVDELEATSSYGGGVASPDAPTPARTHSGSYAGPYASLGSNELIAESSRRRAAVSNAKDYRTSAVKAGADALGRVVQRAPSQAYWKRFHDTLGGDHVVPDLPEVDEDSDMRPSLLLEANIILPPGTAEDSIAETRLSDRVVYTVRNRPEPERHPVLPGKEQSSLPPTYSVMQHMAGVSVSTPVDLRTDTPSGRGGPGIGVLSPSARAVLQAHRNASRRQAPPRVLLGQTRASATDSAPHSASARSALSRSISRDVQAAAEARSAGERERERARPAGLAKPAAGSNNVSFRPQRTASALATNSPLAGVSSRYMSPREAYASARLF